MDAQLEEYLKRKLEQDQADLAETRRATDDNNFKSNFGRAINTISSGLAGTETDNSFYDTLDKQNVQKVADKKTDRALVNDYLMNKYKFDKEAKDAERADKRLENDEWYKKRSLDQGNELKKGDQELRRLQIEAMATQNKNVADEKATKKEEDLKVLNVPGYERDSNIKQTPEEAAKARKAAGTLASVEQSLDRMKDLVDKYGSFEYGGAGGAEMDSLSTTLQIELKNLYELGALSGPDMALLQKQISSPSTLSSMFTRDSTAKSSLEATKNALRRSVQAEMAAKGYKQPTMEQPKSSGPKVGDVVDGYKFLGGDPSKKESWAK